MGEPTKSAKILNADEDFLIVVESAGLSPEEAFDFWFAYLFSLDRFPDQDYESFLPVWKRWQEKKAKQTA